MKRFVQVASLSLIVGAVTFGLTSCSDGSGVDGRRDIAKLRSVTVTGQASVKGVPDTLRATMGVESSGPNVSTVLNETNMQIKKVTDALVAKGVKAEDIQTQNVSVNSRTGPVGEIIGYQASNTVTIIIRDISKASNILDEGLRVGGDAVRFNGISFSIDDDKELLNKARGEAFKDAKARAEQYASLADAKLGVVLTISEESSRQNSSELYDTPMYSKAAGVPVSPGQQTITYTVNVKYALK